MITTIDLSLFITITLAILASGIIKHIYFFVLSKLLSQPTMADPKHSGSAQG